MIRALLLVGLLSCAIVAPGAEARAQLRSGEQPAVAVERLLAAIARLGRDLPADLDDAEALGKTIPDADAAFAWVRENTALTPYRGRLKGAKGVLIDRMGNSLDRSLLLLALLQSTGSEARLVRSELGETAVERVLIDAEGRQPTTTPSPEIGELSDLAAIVGDTVARERIIEARAALNGSADTAFDRVERLTAVLLDDVATIAPATPAQRAAAEKRRQIEAARDHWWVQVRRDDAWTDFDTTLPTPGRSRSSVFAEVDPTRLPQDADQRIDLAVLVETTTMAGDSELAPVLEAELSTASLLGEAIRLRFEPIDGPDRTALAELASRPDAFEQILGDLEAWVPILEIGPRTYRDRVFGADGSTDDIGAESLATLLGGKVRRGVERGVGAAGGMLGRLGTDAKPDTGTAAHRERVLTSVWLRLTVRIPGEQPRPQWRALYDAFARPAGVAPGAATAPPEFDNLERLRRSVALTGDLRFLVEPARTTDPWYARQATRRLADVGPALIAMAGGARADDERLVQSSAALNRADLDLLAVASQRWALNFGADSIFHDRPFVVSVRRGTRLARGAGLRGGKDEGFEIDILENRVGIRLSMSDDPFMARVAQGVADTVAELAAIPAGAVPLGTAAYHHEDILAGRNWVRLNASGAAGAVAPSTQAHIERDLALGFAITLPNTSDGRVPAWWRIDPATGETLGIVAKGSGGVSAETTNVLLQVGSAAACLNALVAKMVLGGLGSADLGLMMICMIGSSLTMIGSVTGTSGAWVGNLGTAINLITTMVTAWTASGTPR